MGKGVRGRIMSELVLAPLFFFLFFFSESPHYLDFARRFLVLLLPPSPLLIYEKWNDTPLFSTPFFCFLLLWFCWHAIRPYLYVGE